MTKVSKLFVIIIVAALLLAACARKTPAIIATVTSEAYPVAGESAGEQMADYPEPTSDVPAPQEVYNPPLPADAIFQVVTEQGVNFPFTTEKIKEMPAASAGEGVEGPLVIKVLEACSLTTFNELVFKAQDGTSVTLTKDQITDKVILGYANGVVRLASPDLPKDKWLDKVVEIRVK